MTDHLWLGAPSAEDNVFPSSNMAAEPRLYNLLALKLAIFWETWETEESEKRLQCGSRAQFMQSFNVGTGDIVGNSGNMKGLIAR